mgnify:CR=1 FL=1
MIGAVIRVSREPPLPQRMFLLTRAKIPEIEIDQWIQGTAPPLLHHDHDGVRPLLPLRLHLQWLVLHAALMLIGTKGNAETRDLLRELLIRGRRIVA